MCEILCINKAKDAITQVNIEIVPQLLSDDNNILWLDFQYPPNVWPDEKELNLLTSTFDIHNLSIEDCVIESNHPKLEDCGSYLQLILFCLNNEKNLKAQKVGLFLGENFIISYTREKINDIETLKENLKANQIPFSKSNVGIFHSIIDHIVDGYMPIIDNYDTQLMKTEEILFKDPSNTKLIKRLNSIRQSMNSTRQIIVHENEILYTLVKKTFPLISEYKKIYFRDIFDHLERDLAKIENIKESISNLLEIQMNINTQNLNEIMKFLTVISTILLPANVIAGIFGMNFEKIPFLHSDYGLVLALASMVVIAVMMVVYFKKKKWL